ncbi:MAG: hypothetical protein JSR59_23045 [Proteobacteria bacterium]|nr:hypothetical protein [Pseudomonadota bacterium]
MNILGYAGLAHDPSVAVLCDGKIRCAIESEKVTRHKHELNVFPEQAMRFALKAAGVEWESIECLAVNYDAGPWANRFYLPHLWRFAKSANFDTGILLNNLMISASHNPRVFRQMHEYTSPKIARVRHHLAHLASSFPYSPYEEAAVVIFDAASELECTSAYHCAGRSIRPLYSMDLPNDSLGSVYMLSTRHLGYKMLGDEYKVMGLAPYGQPHAPFRQFFCRLIRLEPEGRYRVDRTLAGQVFNNGWKFPHAVSRSLEARRHPDADFEQIHMDFAYELQRRVEEAMLHVTRHLHKTTGLQQLCMAGGVALNSVANGKILQESGFRDVFIPPAAHDAGTSLGAATYQHYYVQRGERPEPMRHAYYGPSYDDAYIEDELRRCGQSYVRVADPAAAAARCLADGRIIGWFQGATEFGPRALGSRSILADPRQADTKDKVNRLVKEREGYRPFAPSLLKEAASQYLEHVTDSPFMLLVDAVRRERRHEIPAVVHVDGTARPQTVEQAVNPLFHRLIDQFRQVTGIPVVLNTSFNVAGEPIVNTPVDAVRCFNACGLDALVIGSCIVEKASMRARPDAKSRETGAPSPALMS